MTTRAKHRFGALDALRGTAALVVLVYHFRWLLSPEYAFPGGYLAVDFFFLLSGFVIGHAYDDKILHGMTTTTFIERRLIRFLPLLWVGITIGTLLLTYQLAHGLTGFTKRDVILAALHNALLLPSNFSKDNILFPTNWPEWSLFLELIINCTYVVCYRRLSICVISIIITIGLLGLIVTASHIGNLNAGVYFRDLYAGFARVTFSFFAGLLIYRTRVIWSSYIPRISMWFYQYCWF